MATTWSASDVNDIASAEELLIATFRPDGTLCRPVPIRVVVTDGQVYVRTWQRPETATTLRLRPA